MTMMTDISGDLVEEILSRVPITSLRSVRTTCKQWNALAKDPSFKKKHCGKAGKEIMLIMTYDSRVRLMSFKLHKHKDGLVDPSINQLGEFNGVKILKVFHCHGLLLCEGNNRLVVWNPYLGQTRWIQPSNRKFDIYAFGYDKKKNHKILSFLWTYERGRLNFGYEIYDFSCNSWKILDITSNGVMLYDVLHGVSLKGNSYIVAKEKKNLLCFDFTRERFVPRLHLPFHSCSKDSVILSSVSEEQLAVLFHRHDTHEIEIWITTKIEPDEVSWSNLFKVDRKLFIGRYPGSFVLDEKKKIAMIWGEDRQKKANYKAYMIGEGGYYREEDLGESKRLPLVCSYYVPSSVQIQQGIHAATGKRKQRAH